MKIWSCCPAMRKSGQFNYDERDNKLRLGMEVIVFCPFCGVETEGELAPDLLSAHEKAIIQEFAFGTRELHDQAVQVYARYLRRYRESMRPSSEFKSSRPIEIEFMGEIDNKCPDFTLRQIYRQRVIERWDAAGRPMAMVPGKFYSEPAPEPKKPAKRPAKAARKPGR